MEAEVVFDDTAHVTPDNPEAMFDFLTIQSLKGRFGDIEPSKEASPDIFIGGTDTVYQNDLDFETYVQQFPIDDTISQCFATSSDTIEAKPAPSFISGGKRPDPSGQKLRKKFGRKSADSISQSDDDNGSRDPKRSKPGGVFSKRHKWLSTKYESSKNTRKQLSSSDQSELGSVFLSNTMTRLQDNGTAHDSNSTSDSQITSFSEVFMRNQEDQIVPGATTSTLQKSKLTSDPVEGDDRISLLLRGNSNNMIQQIEDLSPEEATSLRDLHGNTLLHRCVTAGSEDAVKYLMEKFPEMTSDINIENLTAVELAAKIGNYDCLKVMLERNHRRKSLGPSLINRLLTISSQYGQVSCLNLLLQKLTSNPGCVHELQRDPRGNTIAHLAARQGHLNCLQALVAAGFDVTSENLLGQQPLHAAHQNRQHACFEYLLLLDIAQELIKMLPQANHHHRSSAPTLNTALMENIFTCFERFNELFVETQQMLSECKTGIMQTLSNLQHDLELFIRHTSTDMATKRKEAKEKLEEFVGEIERLDDTLEFSPLREKEGALVRLLALVNDDIAKVKEKTTEGAVVNQAVDRQLEHTDKALRSLIKDIHQQYLLENWSVAHIYVKYLNRPTTSTSPVFTPDKPSLYSNNEHSIENTNPDTNCCSDTRQTSNTFEPILQSGKIKSNSDDNDHEYINKTINTQSLDIERKNEEFRNQNDESDIEIDSEKKLSTEIQPTERPFAKLLSLDERIDMLIAGEKAKEKSSDSETIVTADENVVESTDSVYTTTFTSITSESTTGLSDWYKNLGLTSLESSPEDLTTEVTSDTASYWWDQGEARSPRIINGHGPRYENRNSSNITRQIQLRLEQEDASYEELRRQRLLSHLRSVEQSRQASDNFREKITTSTGEVIGGFSYPDTNDITNRIVVDVTGALRKRDVKPIPKPRIDKQKLFTLEDAIATKSHDHVDHSPYRNVSPKMKWEDMSFTDDDDDGTQESLSWYGMRPRSCYGNGSSISERSTTPQSYV